MSRGISDLWAVLRVTARDWFMIHPENLRTGFEYHILELLHGTWQRVGRAWVESPPWAHSRRNGGRGPDLVC